MSDFKIFIIFNINIYNKKWNLFNTNNNSYQNYFLYISNYFDNNYLYIQTIIH